MQDELLRILDEEGRVIGVKPRKEVHKDGDWHETFHCWVTIEKEGKKYLLFQKRHILKETNPGKLSTSVSGHIRADESIADGVRELEEELGIRCDFSDLKYVGTFRYIGRTKKIWDREFNRIYLYESKCNLNDFIIQKDELIGLYLVDIDDFKLLAERIKPFIFVEGFEQRDKGELKIHRKVTRGDFVFPSIEYFRLLFQIL